MDPKFPWETLRSIIGGLSAIDVPRLHCATAEEAEQFLEGYGFDWGRTGHRLELEDLRTEAIRFIEEQLLEEDEAIPAEIREQADPRQLLCWASSSEPTPRQRWSCALLRVAHTLAHSRSYFNDKYGDEIRRQIFERFEPHLRMSDDGLMLGSDEPIALVDFEVKPTKPVQSVAMKLLHKVENVAEDIFDRVGVRFITEERFDALLVVRYLREKNVFMFANVKPSRSRNTLIDLDWLQELMAGLDQEITEGNIPEHERLEVLRAAVREHQYPGPPAPSYNPYSAASYHALQFTCRQMIRVPDDTGRGEIRFFFPFEVQILDEESYQLSRSGYAAHHLYKARQRDAVRDRVFGNLDLST
jgi:uncharacterized protein (TIGR04562 family)